MVVLKREAEPRENGKSKKAKHLWQHLRLFYIRTQNYRTLMNTQRPSQLC